MWWLLHRPLYTQSLFLLLLISLRTGCCVCMSILMNLMHLFLDLWLVFYCNREFALKSHWTLGIVQCLQFEVNPCLSQCSLIWWCMFPWSRVFFYRANMHLPNIWKRCTICKYHLKCSICTIFCNHVIFSLADSMKSQIAQCWHTSQKNISLHQNMSVCVHWLHCIHSLSTAVRSHTGSQCWKWWWQHNTTNISPFCIYTV